MAVSAMTRAAGMAVRFAPEYRHLPIIMAELGWRTGRPTDVHRLPRVFFRELGALRWEVKRGPRGQWRVRYGREVLYPRIGWLWQYNWFIGAPSFDEPVAGVLWFDRIGTTLLKLGVNLNARHAG